MPLVIPANSTLPAPFNTVSVTLTNYNFPPVLDVFPGGRAPAGYPAQIDNMPAYWINGFHFNKGQGNNAAAQMVLPVVGQRTTNFYVLPNPNADPIFIGTTSPDTGEVTVPLNLPDPGVGMT